MASQIAALWEEATGGRKHSSEEEGGGKKINGACQISWSVVFITWHQLCLLYSSAAYHFTSPSSPLPIFPSLPPSRFFSPSLCLPNDWAVGRRYEGGIFSSYKHIKELRERKKKSRFSKMLNWTFGLISSLTHSDFLFSHIPPALFFFPGFHLPTSICSPPLSYPSNLLQLKLVWCTVTAPFIKKLISVSAVLSTSVMMAIALRPRRVNMLLIFWMPREIILACCGRNLPNSR